MKSNRILMAFFSQPGETYVNGAIEVREKGNTQVVAERLAELEEMTLFHIRKRGDYPRTYRAMVDIAKVEWKEDARPEIEGGVVDMEQFDTVILGYPNWCNTMPKPVFTFLESYDFVGKKIIPFCTNEGSRLGQSVDDIRRLCPNSYITDGVSIHGAEVSTVTAELHEIMNHLLD